MVVGEIQVMTWMEFKKWGGGILEFVRTQGHHHTMLSLSSQQQTMKKVDMRINMRELTPSKW